MIGVRGGLVVVSADDPGMHSSQDEQDNRHYAKFVKVPMLEAKVGTKLKLKSLLGISTGVRLLEPGSLARSQGKARRVIDRRDLGC